MTPCVRVKCFLQKNSNFVEIFQSFPADTSIVYTKRRISMVMSWFWILTLSTSFFCSLLTGSDAALASSVIQGAQAGITLAISLAGSLCLWSGVGKLMDAAGMTDALSRLLRPLLYRLFPETKTDAPLRKDLSGNICANLLGLGNAATPMGIRAAKRMTQGEQATDSLCRLIVLNTASIQLIPANVAAVRSGLGCRNPFDILLPVWITSFISAGLGLTAAWALSKMHRP
jgi:spore maturation protein A